MPYHSDITTVFIRKKMEQKVMVVIPGFWSF